MANYGEYSGAPSETQTFEYAKTILKLMTEGEPFPDGIFVFCFSRYPKILICSVQFSVRFPLYFSCVYVCIFLGKVLIIGGGIANFTNVSATFAVSGIVINYL